MTLQQFLAFTVIVLMMAAFIWGKFRYDIVAMCSLLTACLLGVVPYD
ncbi:MAG: SLC13 family permease, partial [Phyllobacterium sp.]